MSGHLALPLRLSEGGTLLTLSEGSPAEVAQSVGVLLATRVGERTLEPAYGSTDPAGTPLAQGGAVAIVDAAAIAFWEPRAAGMVTISASRPRTGA